MTPEGTRSTSAWRPICLTPLWLALLIAMGGAVAPLRASERATAPAANSSISTVPLPGGVEGIRRALGDREVTRPELLGVEIARRFFGGSDETSRHGIAFSQLTAWLQPCTGTTRRSAATKTGTCLDPALSPDQAPLPGPADFWRDVIFQEPVPLEALLPRIFSNRRTALLYAALLMMDGSTRAWMLAEPAMLARLSENQTGVLVVAAPWLRTAGSTWVLPGGDSARPVWLALAGASASDASRFVPAFLTAEQGLLPYLAELASTLTPEQQAAAFGFDRADPVDRVAASRRLLRSLRVALSAWHPGARPFWRPSPDPAWLLSQLAYDANGRLRLPGGYAFWESALTGASVDVTERVAREAWNDPRLVEPAALINRVFAPGLPAQVTTRYEQVLLGRRLFADARPEDARDVLTVLRGHAAFPELVATLERMGVTDAGLIAALVRRADALRAAGADWRGRAGVVQWQSALMLLLRTVQRGTMPPERLTEALRALAGDEGASVQGDTLRWLAAWLGRAPSDADAAGGGLGAALVARLAASNIAPRSITWEEDAYRIDFEAGERRRLEHVRRRSAPRVLDAAMTALALADRLGDGGREAVPADVVTGLDAIDAALPADESEFGREGRAATAAVRRFLSGSPGDTQQARAALYDLADAIGASALLEVTYATVLGWAEDLPLKADGSARRHRLTVGSGRGRDLAWTSPRITTGDGEPWHVRGGVLGLDVALAPVTLRRLSMKPPPAPPGLSDGNRLLLTTTAVLLEAERFTDEAQRELVSLLERARTRLEHTREPQAVESLARDAGVSPLRAGLAGWLAMTNRDGLAGFFSMTERLRMGLEGREMPDPLRRWGNRETLLSGRQACGGLPEWFWERYAGRWSHGMLAYAVPDLQLVLASQLAQMGLPAVLVPDLMAVAVHDFIMSVPTRHADDWQAMVEWAGALTVDTTERYVGKLTTDGPLRVERLPAPSR